MSQSIVFASPAAVDVDPRRIPILPEWVLSGAPISRQKSLVRSRDWTCNMLVWESTAGTFDWHYGKDEMVIIVSGEVEIANDGGEKRCLRSGDFAFFPAGTVCTWHVPEYVKKVAMVREPMWLPFGLALKVWHKFLQLVGLAPKAPL